MKAALLVVAISVSCAAHPASHERPAMPTVVPQLDVAVSHEPVQPVDDIELVDVTTVEDGLALFSHRRPLADVGTHYLVFDAFGGVGTVEILGDSRVDVSGGDGQYVRVRTTSGAVPRAHAYAIGPLPIGALSFARMVPVAAPPPLDEGMWRTTAAIDLNRDTAPDLFAVDRCSHRSASGCRKSVCDERAHALRWAASAPRVVWFEKLIPDVDDCLPLTP